MKKVAHTFSADYSNDIEELSYKMHYPHGHERLSFQTPIQTPVTYLDNATAGQFLDHMTPHTTRIQVSSGNWAEVPDVFPSQAAQSVVHEKHYANQVVSVGYSSHLHDSSKPSYNNTHRIEQAQDIAAPPERVAVDSPAYPLFRRMIATVNDGFVTRWRATQAAKAKIETDYADAKSDLDDSFAPIGAAKRALKQS